MAITTTSTTSRAWSPDLVALAPADALPEALILEETTIAGTVEGDEVTTRVGYVKDAEAATTGEGDELTETVPELAEVEFKTEKLTTYVPVSREQYAQNGTAGQLTASMERSITRKADKTLLYRAPEDPSGIHGLLNYSSIVGGTVGDPDAPEVGDNLDGLIDLIAQLEANGATPSSIIVDPLGWAALQKIKTGDGSNQTLLGAGTSSATAMLLGVPIKRSQYMPAKTGLVIDRTAIASAVGPVNVAASEHALFRQDSIALRVTWRIGFSPVQVDRIGRFTIA